MLNINQIRNDFPQLKSGDYHYLDAAASSLTPNAVLDAEIDYYTHNRANVHRGLFKEAVRATELYEEARRKVAAFINADPSGVIFTGGATESSNMLARMIDDSIRFADEDWEIVTTVMEHHGALIPLQQLALRRDIPLRIIPLLSDGLDYTKAAELISDKTIVVSAMLASNVTGMINDVRRIADIAHQHNATVIVDATAAVGHIPVDVEALGADALYFSGHKMLAPTGVGVLWAKKSVLEKLAPSIFGGHMIAHFDAGKATWAEIPTRFEAGTKNISGVIGLGAAIDYLNTLGLNNIHAHMGELVSYATNKLESIDGVKVISERDPGKNVGIVAFVVEWAHPHDVAEILSRDNVAVRAGHHCSIPIHHALGIESSIRASFHVYNTTEDIDVLIRGIQKTREIFAQ